MGGKMEMKNDAWDEYMKWVDDGEKWCYDMMGRDDAHEPPPKAIHYYMIS